MNNTQLHQTFTLLLFLKVKRYLSAEWVLFQTVPAACTETPLLLGSQGSAAGGHAAPEYQSVGFPVPLSGLDGLLEQLQGMDVNGPASAYNLPTLLAFSVQRKKDEIDVKT